MNAKTTPRKQNHPHHSTTTPTQNRNATTPPCTHHVMYIQVHHRFNHSLVIHIVDLHNTSRTSSPLALDPATSVPVSSPALSYHLRFLWRQVTISCQSFLWGYGLRYWKTARELQEQKKPNGFFFFHFQEENGLPTSQHPTYTHSFLKQHQFKKYPMLSTFPQITIGCYLLKVHHVH